MNDSSLRSQQERFGDEVQVVRSAEQVALHLPIAGPGSRILAYAIDYLVMLAIQAAVLILLALSTPLVSRLLELFQPWIDSVRSGKNDPQLFGYGGLVLFVVLLLVGLVIEFAYFTLSEAMSNGRSIGKRKMGLRVVGEDGLPLGGRASLVRNLLRAVDILPGSYLVGLVALLASRSGQRLGDLAAGTVVVRLDRAVEALPVDEYDVSSSPFRFSRAQLAALGLTEKTLLRQTLRRMESLDSERSEMAVQRAAAVLRARLGVEAGMPGDDEQFLRALLAAIERR